MLEPKIVVDISGLEELARRFPVEARDSRVAHVTEASLLVERSVVEKTPLGGSDYHLAQTIYSQVSRGEPVVGLVGTPAVYGEPLEYGTKAHFPPVGPLVKWARVKFGLDGKAAVSAAWAVARKIAKKGTKGAKMFEAGFGQAEKKAVQILERIPADIVRRVGG